MNSPQRSFRQSLAAMTGLSLVFMLVALNLSVVGTALPQIVADLNGYALYAWAASAFLMTSAVTIPVTGRLGDLHGRKPFLLAAITLFGIASAASGLAQSMIQLVLARGLQGFAGGMIVGTVAASVSDLFPTTSDRVRWQVVLSSSFGIAQAFGPWLGGWLTEHAGWRYVFFINLPVAALALAMVWRHFPHVVHHDDEDRRIDWSGVVVLAIAIVALMLGADFTQAWGLADARSLGTVAVALVLGAVFLRRQYRTPAPIVPPALLDDPGARTLMLLGMLTGLTMFTLVFYAPLLLQGGFGQSPDHAGVVMTPLLVCITLGSIANGRILRRIRRAERPVAWGQAGLLAGCLLLALLGPETPDAWAMAMFALCGVSLGFQLPNFTLQIMEIAGRRHTGAASSLIQSTRMIGSMVGVGLASVLVNSIFARRVGDALARLQVDDATLASLLSSPQVLVRAQDRELLFETAGRLGIDAAPLLVAARDGLVDGAHAAFLACAAIAAACVLISLRLPRFDLRGR